MSFAPIRFEGRIKKAAFARVQNALLPLWLRWYVNLPVILVCLVQIIPGWSNLIREPLRSAPELILVALVIAVYGATKWLVRRRGWKNYTEAHGPISGHLSERGLEWRTQTVTTSIDWSKVTSHRIEDDLILIYYAPRCAFFLPRDFFANEQDWNAAKQLILSNGPQR